MVFFRAPSFAALLFFPAACGARVVVDATEGAGGQGSTSTTTTSTTSISTSTSSSTSSGNLCGSACSALANKGCASGGCVAQCDAVLAGAPQCAAQASAMLACIAAEAAPAPSCFVYACTKERDAFQTCTAAGLCKAPNLGGGSPGGCVGQGICGGGSISAQCNSGGYCDCISGSGTKSSCQETGPFLCDIVDGCCATLVPSGG